MWIVSQHEAVICISILDALNQLSIEKSEAERYQISLASLVEVLSEIANITRLISFAPPIKRDGIFATFFYDTQISLLVLLNLFFLVIAYEFPAKWAITPNREL